MTFSKCFSAFAMLGGLLLSAPARADLAPTDECYAPDVGKACSNAIVDGSPFQPGICTQTDCTRATPQGSMTFSCYRCLMEDGGAGGQAHETGGTSSAGQANTAGSTPVNPAGGTSAGGTSSGGSANTAGTKSSAGSSSDSKSSDDGGCSVSQARGGAGAGSLLVALGLAVAVLRRRRTPAS